MAGEAYLSIKKTINIKHTVNVKLNKEHFVEFLLRQRTRQGSPFSSLLFSIMLKALATAITEEKKTNGIHIDKEEINVLT